MINRAELTYLSCSGDETQVSDCKCDSELDCCQANMTLDIRCKPIECSVSILTLALGAVSGLLLTLLLATTIAMVILGVKLKQTQRKRRYESEPHHYVQQQIGQ